MDKNSYARTGGSKLLLSTSYSEAQHALHITDIQIQSNMMHTCIHPVLSIKESIPSPETVFPTVASTSE